MERDTEKELWMVFIFLSVQTFPWQKKPKKKQFDPTPHQKWKGNAPLSREFTVYHPIHSMYLAKLPAVVCLSWRVASISTDIFQMLVALIRSPLFPHLPPLSHAANELAWKQLFSGNMTYNSSKMHLAQMNSSRICLEQKSF